APMLDTEGTSQQVLPRRPRVFREVRQSERQYRNAVAAELSRYASELPKGKTRRRWNGAAKRLLDCGTLIAFRHCGMCGGPIVDTARLLTTCQLRGCPTCARYLANEARSKAREVLKRLPRVEGFGFFAMHFTSRFDPTDPAEFACGALLARSQVV